MAVDRSKQGTAFSGFEANDQTEKQREAFETEEGYGASKSLNLVSNIFSDDRPTPNEIMSAALMKFGTASSIPLGENPDFSGGFSHLELNFSNGDDKFSEADIVADKPSKLGPNLKVPDINNLPDNSTEIANDTSTLVPENSDGTFTNYGEAGFGTSIDRNNPEYSRANPNSSSFLVRRGASVVDSSYTSRSGDQETLGEYLDNDTYGYAE